MKRQSIKEVVIPTVIKYTKPSPMFLKIKEMQIITILKHCISPIRMEILKILRIYHAEETVRK